MVLYTSSLIQKLREMYTHSPEFTLLEEGDISYSIANIFERAKALAVGMAVKGVQAGDTIVVALPPGYQFVTYLLAGTLLNARLALIDPEMGNENYQSKLKQLSPRFAICDKRLLLLQEHPIIAWIAKHFMKRIPMFPHSKGITYFTDNSFLPILKTHFPSNRLVKQNNKIEIEWKEAEGNSDAFIVYTSGTTQIPKGVLHSLNSFHASIARLSALLPLKGMRIGVQLPHFVFLAIASEAQAIVLPRFNRIESYYRFLEENNIEVLFGPPSEFLPVLEYCRQQNVRLPKSLKFILLGSAPVHIPFLKELIRLTDAEIRCVYGMTEHLLTTICDGRIKAEDQSGMDMLGNFIPGVEYNIESDGELCIKSEQLFKRYYHLQKANAYHRTGDLVCLKNNILYLTGRKKNMIIRKNFNLYPELYEHTIMKIEGVREALLLGVYNDDIHDERVYLLIDGTISKQKLMQELNSGKYSIDKEAIPDDIIFTSIPHAGRQSKADRASAVKQIQKLNT